MDISITNNGYSVRPPERPDPRPAAAPPRNPSTGAVGSDSVSFSEEGLKVSRWIEQAKSEPEVRAEKVAEFKERVQSGNYPPPQVAEGLARLLGTGILSTQRS